LCHDSDSPILHAGDRRVRVAPTKNDPDEAKMPDEISNDLFGGPPLNDPFFDITQPVH
jgi:hypothetical protein